MRETRRKDTVSSLLAGVSCLMTPTDMHMHAGTIETAASILINRWDDPPDIAIVAGSGLSMLRSIGTLLDTVNCSDIPGIIGSSVAGHGSDICLLSLGGLRVMLFTGRLHLYEGLAPDTVAQHIMLTRMLGCNSVLLTNASGGLHPLLSVGNVVLVSDVINMTFRSIASSCGRVLHRQFDVLDRQWQQRIIDASVRSGVPIRRGVFAQMLGPSYETRAEVRMLRRIGADLVGMSSAVEARWASSVGMRIVMLSVVTNTLTDSAVRYVSHDEVLTAGRIAEHDFVNAVRCAIESCPPGV